MKDIAARCNVSVATVSKALNGLQDIGAETRERVMKAAEEMGYFKNSAARALRTKRTYDIGVLFDDPQGSGLAHEFFSLVLDGIRAEAERSGYDITFINRNIGRDPCTYLQHCLYRGVDGVVVASVDFKDPMVWELMDSKLPVVTIDHVFNNRLAVTSDNVSGGETLVRYAVSMGHRKIAFIHGELTTVTQNRLTGFYRACEEAGLTISEDYVRESPYHDTESCYRVTKELLALPDRPTCILFPDDFSYLGGLKAIQEAGLKVPDDISVMGYDGIHLSRVISPRLTTYRQDTDALGRTATARLIEQIESPKTTLLDRVIVPGGLQEGETVARLGG